jgi:hypothetical protein
MVQSGKPFASAASAVITMGCGGSTATVLIVPFGVTRRMSLPAASAMYTPPGASATEYGCESTSPV